MPQTLDVEFPEKLRCLFDPARYKILHGGRGASKSWGVARALLIQGAGKPLRILCARETQKSIAESVHQLLRDQVAALGLEAVYTVQETSIFARNGTQFSFAGLRQQNITSIKSYEGVDICWVEEAQVVTKKSWDILIPTIRKPDSEIWVTFNPELETDETYDRFVTSPPEGSIVQEVNWSDNPWFPEVLRKEKDELKKRDHSDYLTVWEGKCRPAVQGAVYLNEIRQMEEEKRIQNVPYDPMLKVHVCYDLGWNDAMSMIFVQRVASEIRVIDYIEDSHKTLDQYVQMLKEKKYNYGTDYLPHDGASGTLQSGGKSTQQILQALGRQVQVIPRGDIEEGIRQARMVFSRCYIDKEKARRLVNCLKRYRRTINQQTNEPGAPLHDEHSHGADAFRALAAVVDQMSNDNNNSVIKYPKLGLV